MVKCSSLLKLIYQLQNTIDAQKNWGKQKLALKAVGQQESTEFLSPKASSEEKIQWFVLQLGPCYTSFTQLVRFWSLFLSKVCVCNWQWRFIRSLLMFEGKNPEILEKEDSGWIMEQFLWRDRLSTADSEISPRMHRESAKGSGAFLFIRTFFSPSYTLWKTSFRTLTQMKTLTQRAFWRQDFFPLLVWFEILDDVPCYLRACNLEFTLWRPAYHPHRVQYMSRVFSIYYFF